VKLSLAIIPIIAACLFTISKLHDDGTMILASMAEEYSLCTNVNACSDEDLAEMADLLLEQDEYNSSMWLRVVLGWGHWRNRLGPHSSARDFSPARYGNQ
jgi:hypothetical protein